MTEKNEFWDKLTKRSEKEQKEKEIIEKCKALRDQSKDSVPAVGPSGPTHELVGSRVVESGGSELPPGGRIRSFHTVCPLQ